MKVKVAKKTVLDQSHSPSWAPFWVPKGAQGRPKRSPRLPKRPSRGLKTPKKRPRGPKDPPRDAARAP